MVKMLESFENSKKKKKKNNKMKYLQNCPFCSNIPSLQSSISHLKEKQVQRKMFPVIVLKYFEIYYLESAFF